MALFGGTHDRRRLRLEPRPSPWTAFTRRVSDHTRLLVLPVSLALVLWLTLCMLMLWDRREVPFRLGESLPTEVRARLAFTASIRPRPERIRENTPNVFVLNIALVEQIVSGVRDGVAFARQAGTYAEFQRLASGRSFARLSETDWATIRAAQDGDLALASALDELQAWLIQQRYLGPSDRQTPSQDVVLLTSRSDVGGRTLPLAECRVATSSEARNELLNKFRWGGGPLEPFPVAVRALVREVLLVRLSADQHAAALYVYDPELTEREMALRSQPQRIVPEARPFKSGETLVFAGVLDVAERDLLEQENAAYWSARDHDPETRLRDIAIIISGMLVMAGVVIGLAMYVAVFQQRLCRDRWHLISLASTVLAVAAVSKLLMILAPERLAETVVLPVTMAAAILTIAYQQRFAFGISAIIVIMCTLVVGGSVQLFLVLTTASACMTFAVDDVRTRGKLIASGLFTALAVFGITVVTRLALGDLHYSDTTTYNAGFEALMAAAWGAAFAVLAGFLTLGILPMVERVFGVATTMTLLEWSDPNRPLLNRLALEAPGTYNHSLVVATLAEAGATAIGANGLLARVGALYHDIGKINKPLYFIENQTGEFNRHEHLSPAMSLLVIVGHVKDGLEFAQEYDLPRVLHGFIATHHGTMLVEYFYHAARQEAQRRRENREIVVPVEPHQFRYPGPRPQTKETAILLLCDGVEAATRAMREPTPVRIEALVSSILKSRLEDGQFDEADITLRELSIAQRAIVKTLISIYHGRVQYPTADRSGRKAPGRQDVSASASVSSASESAIARQRQSRSPMSARPQTLSMPPSQPLLASPVHSLSPSQLQSPSQSQSLGQPHSQPLPLSADEPVSRLSGGHANMPATNAGPEVACDAMPKSMELATQTQPPPPLDRPD